MTSETSTSVAETYEEKLIRFRAHLTAYAVFSVWLTAFWVLTGSGAFWPAFPILAWGLWVAIHAACLYQERPARPST